MGASNLAANQDEFVLWKKDAIRVFREQLFFKKFMGTDENSIVQLITEPRKTDTGLKTQIGLVPDLTGNGVVGDNELEGREEEIEAYWIDINCDLHRNAVATKGKKNDRKSVFKARTEARDKLMRWKANLADELMMLTAAGISYAYNTNGTLRTGSGDPLTGLDFAADVSAPTSLRHYRYTGTALAAGDTTAIDANHVPKYNMLVDLKAEAKTRGIKPLKIGGKDHYVYVCDPRHFARLKKDGDFRDSLINAGQRGENNPVFTGADAITMDGIIIHTHNKAFNTSGAANGSKWGAAGLVNGTRSLLMGCQALAFADITDSMGWEEITRNYGNRYGIAISNFYGLLKPKFVSHFDGDTVQDFGVMAVDTAL